MSPEFGATMSYFPIDETTLQYLERTGRSSEVIQRVSAYCKAQGIFRTDATADPVFSDTLELDLSTVETSVAGPKRPQDRITLKNLPEEWNEILSRPTSERGYQLTDIEKQKNLL